MSVFRRVFNSFFYITGLTLLALIFQQQLAVVDAQASAAGGKKKGPPACTSVSILSSDSVLLFICLFGIELDIHTTKTGTVLPSTSTSMSMIRLLAI